MKTFEEWCEFFKGIEKDPSKPVTGLTVRDFLQARAHLYVCEECDKRADRTLKSRKPTIDPSMIN